MIVKEPGPHKPMIRFFLLSIISLCLVACQPQTPCTGWECEISGTLYADAVSDSSELADVSVELRQISWCSPTKGEQQTVSASDGTFSFIVFLHDTDSFVITVDHPEFMPFEQKFGGFDCLSCHCSPLELVLKSN